MTDRVLMDMQAMVTEFHRAKGAAVCRPVREWSASRINLLREECMELIKAIESGDPVAIMHESTDVVYVAMGNAVALGYELFPVFREVHRANMSKVSDPDGTLSHKAHKGADYVPANIADAMAGVTDNEEISPLWSNLLSALTLLSKHSFSNYPTWCEHDVLHVNADDEAFTPEEITQLEQWGFHRDEEEGGFYSFRYGSA